MKLPQDPFMLLSVVNMKLRDDYPSLSDFCLGEGVDEATISDTLRNAGFEYNPDLNQFR